MSAERQGWFADRDVEAGERYPWRPYLQLDGCCLSLEVWFANEAECLDFIKRDVVGQGILE